MAIAPAPTSESHCRACPLRRHVRFQSPTDDEIDLVQSLKRREDRLGAGETLIHEGQTDAPLYTLRHGWAFRYKTLIDGRRQILSFLLAGDFIGVQQKMGDAAAMQDDAGCGGVPFPLTQQHVADGLGLSLVHTNETMRKLERRGLHRIEGGRLHLRDVHSLARLADLWGDGRPGWCRVDRHGSTTVPSTLADPLLPIHP